MTRTWTRALTVLALMIATALGVTASAQAVTPPANQSLLGRWKYQNSHSVAELVGVFFTNPKNGWLVGGEESNLRPDRTTVVRHTANGGDTWVDDAAAKAAENLAAGHELKRVFQFGSHVWILGEAVEDPSGMTVPCDSTTPSNTPNEQAIIIHSANGGRTWTRQASGTCVDLESIYMFDSQHGLIGVNPGPPTFGPEGTYLQTSNGGGTWTPRTLTQAGAPGCNIADSLFFPRSNKPFNQREGWAADTCIVHTKDGGQTWTEQTVDGAPGTSGWEHVLGANGTMIVVREISPSTANVARYNPAGVGTWTTQSVSGPDNPGNPGFGGDLYTLVFVENRWYIIGESLGEESPSMFVSTSNGVSWGELKPPGGMGEPQSGSAFTLDSKHAWVVGQQGSVFAYRVEPPPPPAPSCRLSPAGGKSSFLVKTRHRRVIAAKTSKGTFKVSVKCDQDAVGPISGKVTEKVGGKTKTFKFKRRQLSLKKNRAKTVTFKLAKAARNGLAQGAETTATILFTGANSTGKGNASLNAPVVPKQ